MAQMHDPNQNHLLAALPPADFERLSPHLELVPVALGEFLYEPGTLLRHVYFPTTAIISPNRSPTKPRFWLKKRVLSLVGLYP